MLDLKSDPQFDWTRFYQAFAEGLLMFKPDRHLLVAGIHAISADGVGLGNLVDRFSDGTRGPLKDICPFSVFAMFNRGLTDSNRHLVAQRLARLVGVAEPLPQRFHGMPVVFNMNSWFFPFAERRGPTEIDDLWELLEAAGRYADRPDVSSKDRFIEAYDRVQARPSLRWKLTFGLYWARPWSFPSLDELSRRYVTGELGIPIGASGPGKRCSGEDYVKLISTLEHKMQDEAFPVHSFPHLCLNAWLERRRPSEEPPENEPSGNGPSARPHAAQADASEIEAVQYTVDTILADGCFLTRLELESILQRLRDKKNLILQGPPGTGKTWLAKRLAYALVGFCDSKRVQSIQFHPSSSYEDFVRGWRPSSADGKLALVDGPLMNMVDAALNDPGTPHVLVIEEINRGNPAQILGETLTLLEADKRWPEEALRLSYPATPAERVHIPPNLYVIGTMNIADRSLALVDMALRRRFAFVTLEPRFGRIWRDWVAAHNGCDPATLDAIERRIFRLNETIAADPSLGPHFRVGHSFVTPPADVRIGDYEAWFRQVVETEIAPLLEEYWFDSLSKAHDQRQKLLADL